MDRNCIPLVDALAVSVAIHEKYGFQSKAATDHTSLQNDKICNLDGKGKPIANSARLYRQLFPSQKVAPEKREKIEIADYHYDKAENILNLLRGFGFIAIERPLTKFEESVLDIVNRTNITHKDLGRVASFPNVYERKISQETWEERESQLAKISEFTGTISAKSDFNVVIENVRYLSRTQSYLVCASELNQNIIKFFVSEQKIRNISEGKNFTISGFVKKQEVSKFHGGKETMLNSIKII